MKDGLGTCVTASQTTLIFTRPGLDPWEEKNIEWFPAQGPEWPRAHYESVKNGYDFMGGFKGGRIRIGWQDDPPPPPKPSRPKPCPDDEHLERWIAHRRITGYLEKEARVAWATFREITDGKPLKDCDRDDGRKLVAHFEGIGNRRATIGKKVGHLCAAVNLAIDEGKLKFNPFASVLPKEKEGDAEKREPMSDEDMATVRAGLDTLDDQERLLWMLLATTGMRRGEAFQIKREFREQGIRYVIVGSKTDASLRRVPLPDAVLPLLPAKIEGPLFADMSPKGIKNLGRELLRAIRKLGVGGNLKDLHSLRHRAKDRLRAEGCPEDLQKWCLGHDKRTVSDGYGKGPPVTLLKPWIEKIGY